MNNLMMMLSLVHVHCLRKQDIRSNVVEELDFGARAGCATVSPIPQYLAGEGVLRGRVSRQSSSKQDLVLRRFRPWAPKSIAK